MGIRFGLCLGGTGDRDYLPFFLPNTITNIGLNLNSVGATDVKKIFTHSKDLPEHFVAAYVAA